MPGHPSEENYRYHTDISRRVHPRLSTATRKAQVRLLALDPGRALFRLALAATAALGVVLGVEYLFALLAGAGSARTAMLLGGIAAMQISGSLMQPSWEQRLGLVAWQPVAAGIGLVLSVSSERFGGPALHLGLFVVVTFLAVLVRRLSAQFAVLGLIGWVAYFICTFITPPLASVPLLLGAEVLSSATVFGLSLLLWGHRPDGALRNAVNAWESQVALLLLTAARLTAPGVAPHRRARLRARLRSQAVRISDTAVLIEGWLGHLDPHEEPHPAETRERLFDAHRAVDALVDATLDLTRCDQAAGDDVLRNATALLECLALGRETQAAAHARDLLAADSEAARTFPVGAAGRLGTAGLDILVARRRRTVEPPARAAANPSSKVVLPAGGLPAGTAAAAAQVPPRAHPAFHRLTMPTRQTIQATVATAIALPLGYLISPVHYTWALVAVFIVFLGPSTRGEILVKAAHRAIGTIGDSSSSPPWRPSRPTTRCGSSPSPSSPASSATTS